MSRSASCCCRKPDLLLLDEPTNHLDAETIAWLEKHLREYPGAVMMITHDRYFLDNVTGWILELDRGRGIPYEGNYSAYLQAKAKRMQQEGREDASRQKAIAREQEWIASSPKARQAKSKARIKAYDELVEAADEHASGRCPDHHSGRRAPRPGGHRGGQASPRAMAIALLIDDLSFKLPPGGIVGVIGPNGAGKTTLFRMITGQEKPDSGTIRIGDTVHLGYVDQSRDALDGNKTVWEEISGGDDIIKLGKFEMNSPRLLRRLQLQGRRPAAEGRHAFRRPAQPRAPGQDAEGRRQCAAARRTDQRPRHRNAGALWKIALENFAGCAVIISHDRMFLDRLATHILAFEGDSHVEWFEGNFEDYEKDKIRRLGAECGQSEPRDLQAPDALIGLRLDLRKAASGPLFLCRIPYSRTCRDLTLAWRAQIT